MATIKSVSNFDGTPVYDFVGNSEETKPEGANVGENSTFTELDTGRQFFKKGAAWANMTPPGGGSSGGGLPINFPTEGAANANKFVGFDENGNYTSINAPEEIPSITGKNGKVLGVTLNQDDEEQVEWVDVKTPLVVSEFEPDPADQTHSICDYTSQQLYDAMRAGRTVTAAIGEGEGSMVIPFVGAVQVTSTTVMFFVPDFEHGGFDSLERVLADPFWLSAE